MVSGPAPGRSVMEDERRSVSRPAVGISEPAPVGKFDRPLAGLGGVRRHDPCYPASTTFHRLGEMGARRPFFMKSGKNVGGQMEGVHTKERQLEQELAGRNEQRGPGTGGLAVELPRPERLFV